jgi:ribokinase
MKTKRWDTIGQTYTFDIFPEKQEKVLIKNLDEDTFRPVCQMCRFDPNLITGYNSFRKNGAMNAMSSRSRPKIVVVGSSNTDMNIKAPRIPRPGETILGSEFFMAAGGKGANQAVAAARAGAEVHFVARIGDDLFGRQAKEGFETEGIDTRHVIKTLGRASGVALIIVDESGENSIAVASGANALLSPQDIEAAGPVISSSAVLLTQFETPMETVHRAAEIAANHGCKVIINPAPAQPILSGDFLKHVSILTPNETETEILTGLRIRSDEDMAEAADILLTIGLEAVLITLGGRGVFAAASDIKEFVPSFSVKAVDTTAAGDVFNGALAVALAEGMPLLEAARFANAAAALSVTKMGAQPSAPFRTEIDALLDGT